MQAQDVRNVLTAIHGDSVEESTNSVEPKVSPVDSVQSVVTPSTIEQPVGRLVHENPNPTVVQGHVETGVDLDKNGLPWDARIHAGSKLKTAKGIWKKRKGVDDATYTAVVQELEGNETETPAPPVVTPIAQAAVETPAPVVTPQPAPTPAVPQPMNVAPVAIERDFKGLMAKITSLFAAQKIETTYPQENIVKRINESFASEGVNLNAITDIANEPRFIEFAWQCLEVDGV